MNWRLWAGTFALLATPLTTQASPVLYSGTIGKAAIVLELDTSDSGQASGRYFYQKYLRDLALEGRLDGSQLDLREGDRWQQDPPHLRLRKDGLGWKGQWRDITGKTLPVRLKPASLTPLPADAGRFLSEQRKQAPYDYQRLVQLALVPGEQQRFMGYTMQWLKEPRSGLSMPQLLSGYSDAQRAVLNARLRDRLLEELLAYHACMLGGGEQNADFEQTVTPQFMNAAVLSISVFTSYYCGGAHPDFGDSPLNLAVDSGAELSLEDVLWVGSGAPQHFEPRGSDAAFKAYSEYRSGQLAPWLVAAFTRLYPKAMSAEGGDDDCDYRDPGIWAFPEWHFTPKGVYLGPYFARVMRACEQPDWSVLPYAQIKARPGALSLALP